ncbi:MAG: hypothetical protein AB7P12_17060, partial [Alphaproteobacteria bacterium]
MAGAFDDLIPTATNAPRGYFSDLIPGATPRADGPVPQGVDAAAIGKLVGDAVKGTGEAAHREFLANPVGRPAWLPSPGAAVTGGLRDLGVGLARLPFDLAGAEETSRAIGEAVPSVPMPNQASAIMAALVQYGIPAGQAVKLTSHLLKSAPLAAKIGGGAVGAAVSDFAATDPDKAATLGDMVGGPTALQPGDSNLAKRLKVGIEGGAVTGLADTLLRGGASMLRGKAQDAPAAAAGAPGAVPNVPPHLLRGIAQWIRSGRVAVADGVVAPEIQRLLKLNGIADVPAQTLAGFKTMLEHGVEDATAAFNAAARGLRPAPPRGDAPAPVKAAEMLPT